MKPQALRRLAAFVLALGAQAACWAAGAPGVLDFSPAERAAILSHGPWPPPLQPDRSNRLSGDARAIAFGRQLFSDPRLSGRQDRSCASCHDPGRGFTDGLPRAAGPSGEPLARNTPSVVDSRFHRWQGWSGASDSLWSASLRPLSDASEMGPAERVVAARVRTDAPFAQAFRHAIGRDPPKDDDQLLSDLGKALAAWQETQVSPRTQFDAFRDAVERANWTAAARYPIAAQRGLRLFVGSARCASCHSGPLFTHGEFDQAGIAVRKRDGRTDWGRYEGVKALRASRFNLMSAHNDDPQGSESVRTRHAALGLETYGSFRVPGLRGAARTAPYMHDGSLPSLRAVVEHYAGLDEVKLHIAAAHPHAEPGEPIPPRPVLSLLGGLTLGPGDIDDLVTFLETLSAPELRPSRRARWWKRPPGDPARPSRVVKRSSRVLTALPTAERRQLRHCIPRSSP